MDLSLRDLAPLYSFAVKPNKSQVELDRETFFQTLFGRTFSAPLAAFFCTTFKASTGESADMLFNTAPNK